MAYEPLTPMPFLPIPGLFNLNTFIPGSSDYEIMAKLVETYNHAVELFNQIISQYSDIDKTIEELTKEYQKQLDEYKAETDANITNFEQNVNQTVNNQNSKIAELAETVTKLQKDVDDLINGEYIDNYVKALATWIDNNLQQLVAKVVKYVWFEVDDSGYFLAYIPDTWDFVDFGTELNPDNEDYGKLVLEWEPDVVTDAAYQAVPIPDTTTEVYIPNKTTAETAWDNDNPKALPNAGVWFTLSEQKILKTISFKPATTPFNGNIVIVASGKLLLRKNFKNAVTENIDIDVIIPANEQIKITINNTDTSSNAFAKVGMHNPIPDDKPSWYTENTKGDNYFSGTLTFK